MKNLYLLLFTISLISCHKKEQLSTKFSSEILNCNTQFIDEPVDQLTSTKHGFTFKYPKGWNNIEEDDSSNHSYCATIHPININQDEPLPSIQVIKWHGFQNSIDYFNSDIQKIKTKYNGKILDKGTFETNQIKYNWMITVTTTENEKSTQLLFYTKKEPLEHYMLTFSCLHKEELLDVICRTYPFIESFQIK